MRPSTLGVPWVLLLPRGVQEPDVEGTIEVLFVIKGVENTSENGDPVGSVTVFQLSYT